MYVGIDHSTTGVKTCITDENEPIDSFEVEQTPGRSVDWSYLEHLATHVDLEAIEMIAYGYSAGDNFSSIKPIEDTENRGLANPTFLGNGGGGGTIVFEELRDSSLPCVVYPGVHDDLETLHPYFTYQSPMAGSDKVAMSRYAQEVTEDGSNVIAACVSSSEVATMILDGELTGAFTWMGLVHGWPAPSDLHALEEGELDLESLIRDCGFLGRSGKKPGAVNGVPDEHLLEMVCCATAHNVYSLVPFAAMEGAAIDSIVVSGRLSRVTEPIDTEAWLREAVGDVASLQFADQYSTARGAAAIAEDVHRGESAVLGIPVRSVEQ